MELRSEDPVNTTDTIMLYTHFTLVINRLKECAQNALDSPAVFCLHCSILDFYIKVLQSIYGSVLCNYS